MPAILAFGDSIVYGYADTRGGWVQRLRSNIDEEYLKNGKRFFGSIFNLGVSGNTSEDLLSRLEADSLGRLGSDNVILISIGVNDSAIWVESGENWVKFEKYKENLLRIIEKAGGFSNQIILIGITPVDSDILSPCPWDTRIKYTSSEIERYNNAMKEVAEKNNIIFIDLLPELDNQDYIKTMLIDGVHPNDEGHQLMFEVIKRELEKAKVI